MGRAREPPRDIFIRRWRGGDRSCSPQGFDVLVTNPYPGLRSFSRELRPFFFGREKQKEDLRRYFSESEPGRPGSANRITFVVGGSGSGKSSLTRAGLLAEIHGIPLQGHRGAWYIAEMHPEKDPVTQLLKSLHKVLYSHFVELAFRRSDQPDARGLKERLRQAAADCGIAWGADDDIDSVGRSLSQWLEARLWPPPSRQGSRRVDVGELFRFVDKVLYAFDTAASSGERAGPPRLLLHVDQLEEVFRDECDADGRAALIGLLLDVHEFRPDHLFVVATMRSEELHRFSEYTGMAEVINTSMYLVDLMADDDIDAAIVGGAARLAAYWELPVRKSPTAPFTEETVEALTDAFDEAGRVASHTADRLPLLQHVLPLVWERAVDDWIGRIEKDAAAIFEVTPAHLEAVPGWLEEQAGGQPTKSGDERNDSRLGRCLNARASQVWQDSLAAFGNIAQAEGILRVALCSLAQLDDQGRAVRRFASVDQMLEAAGGAQQDGLRQRLKAALKKFVKATLIEKRSSGQPGKADNYDVSHESLIRNWKMYGSWLEAEKGLRERLYDIERSIGDLERTESYGWRARFLRRDKSEAFAKITSEGVDDLAMIFEEPQPLYSEKWAVGALLQEYRADSVRRLPDPESLGKRVAKIRDTWQLAREWKLWGKRQQETRERRLIAGALVFGVGVLALAGSLVFASRQLAESRKLTELLQEGTKRLTVQAEQLDELTKQLKIALGANEALNGRTVTHDRYLYKIIQDVKGYEPRPDLNDEQERVLRQTAGNLDGGIRKKYGADLMQRGTAPATHSSPTAATCEPANPNLQEYVAFENGRPVILMAEVGRNPTFPNLTAGWMCVSPDGRWLLTVDRVGLPTGMSRLIRQVRHGVAGTNRASDEDIPDVLPVRSPGSDESGAFAARWYSNFKPSSGVEVKYFSDDGFAGFTTSTAEKSGVSVWTQTGLLDPDDSMQPSAWLDWRLCTPVDRDSANGKIRVCTIDDIKLDRPPKYLAIVMPVSGSANCIEHIRCLATVKIHYGKAKPSASAPYADTDLVRAEIPVSLPMIKQVAMDGDWLWLKDANGRMWRYAVGTGPVLRMLERRWGGARPASRQIPESCKAIADCEKFLQCREDGWPGLEPTSEACQ